MFAINMAREPGLPSLWVGFAHSISRVSTKNLDTSNGKYHGNRQFPVTQKILETNGNALSLGQILLDYFPSLLDQRKARH